jgi:CMP-N-acetylneuraminic acid synthetase
LKRLDIALIPARSGSKRIPNKNIKKLNCVPLIAYTIRTALESNLFSEVIVSTDDFTIANIATEWGAKVPKLRPKSLATDSSPDIDWVMHCVNEMISTPPEQISTVTILRPTNPLRTSNSIINGMKIFKLNEWADSLRAMEITDKHPGKMWVLNDKKIALPYLDQSKEIIPTHSSPTQSLEKLWIQNASLEIINMQTINLMQSISGNKILGFEMPRFEGFDLNSELDWMFLEFLISENKVNLPRLISP